MTDYPVITLCGSTRFKEDFERINKELTLQGNIIISVGCFGHSGDTFTDEQKITLDDIHKRKIDMADAIYVINKNGYIGSSTRSEIDYAKEHHKKIYYMEPIEGETPIYAIYVYDEPITVEDDFFNFHNRELVGFYHEKDTAIKAVEENWCDIQDYYAKAAMVVELIPGLYPSTPRSRCWYYIWDSKQRSFISAKLPDGGGWIE